MPQHTPPSILEIMWMIVLQSSIHNAAPIHELSIIVCRVCIGELKKLSNHALNVCIGCVIYTHFDFIHDHSFGVYNMAQAKEQIFQINILPSGISIPQTSSIKQKMNERALPHRVPKLD